MTRSKLCQVLTASPTATLLLLISSCPVKPLSNPRASLLSAASKTGHAAAPCIVSWSSLSSGSKKSLAHQRTAQIPAFKLPATDLCYFDSEQVRQPQAFLPHNVCKPGDVARDVPLGADHRFVQYSSVSSHPDSHCPISCRCTRRHYQVTHGLRHCQ